MSRILRRMISVTLTTILILQTIYIVNATEKDENDMVCITLLQDVDVTIVSLRLNGQEASWYSENRKIFLDSPVSKKNSIVEMVVLVNGVQLCSSPVWEIS